MSRYKVIVCLANSHKLQGHCVAGKEVKSSGFGKWVRPISATGKGELSLQDIAYHNDQIPQLLDIIRVPIKKHRPHGYQTENFLIDNTAYWEHKGKVDVSRLPSLCDLVDSLWTNGFHSFNGINDRIPLSLAENQVKTSLLLIHPTKLSLNVALELNSRKVRAYFSFRGTFYRLAVTDPLVVDIYRQKNDGIYPVSKRNVFLCISLGEPYNGFAYKLVAAIINLPKE